MLYGTLTSMVKRPKKLEAFEKTLLLKEKLSYREALSVFNALYEEALHLRVFSNRNPLYGLDDTLRLAKFLNFKTIHG